jgi:hypothetical protein
VAKIVPAATNASVCGTTLPLKAFVFSLEPDGSRPWRPDVVLVLTLTLRVGDPAVDRYSPRGMARSWAVLLLGASIAAACTSGGNSPSVGSPVTPHAAAERFAGTATVLETKDHGPELCVVATQPLDPPPRCRGVPISNWRWGPAKGKKLDRGTTWGAYRVVGTYDGKAFALTEPPGPPGPSTLYPEEPITTPCSPPAGGWHPVDPGRTSEHALAAAVAAARHAPDFAGVWIADAGTLSPVLNVAFTGELGSHEAKLRQSWGGALCVVRHNRTLLELKSIQGDFSAPEGPPFGLHIAAVGVQENTNQVVVRALLVDDVTRRAIETRYGVGAVKVITALAPAP